MSLSIAAYSQAGDLIEDADVDDNAEITIAKLSTRTLSLSFPGPMFNRTGSGVIGTFLGVCGGVVLPNANSSGLFISFPLPDNFVSTPILRVWWLTSVTSGDIELTVDYKSTTSGGTTTSERTVVQTDTAKGTTNLINNFTITLTGSDFTAGDMVGLQISRYPANAADTLSSDMTFLACALEYTGRA